MVLWVPGPFALGPFSLKLGPFTLIIILKYLKHDLRFVMNSKTNLKHFLYTKLKSNYNRLWFLSLHDDKINKDFGNKLRTYRLFKNNISLEPYLSMKNDEQRILLSKLRISNHNLEIERGRHRGLQAKERNSLLIKM